MRIMCLPLPNLPSALGCCSHEKGLVVVQGRIAGLQRNVRVTRLDKNSAGMAVADLQGIRRWAAAYISRS